MRLAIIVESLGAPGTLASAAFIGAFAEGMRSIGVATRVIALSVSQGDALPATLDLGDVSSLHPAAAPRICDRLRAAFSGAMDPDVLGPAQDWQSESWFAEHLLQCELNTFYEDDRDCVVMVYPRSYSLLRTVVRVSARLGCKNLGLSTEALTESQIDLATRSAYVDMVATRCDGVWVLSDYLGVFWQSQGVSPHRLVHALPPVRASFFGDSASGPSKCAGVYVGNLAYREVDYLIDIAELVHGELPQFNLRIYGDAGPDRIDELRRAIADRLLEDTVFLEPRVAPAEIPSVLSSADVLLLPRQAGVFSTAGFPNKLGEYLASGRPVVVTRVGDIPKYLKDGESAMLVDSGDTASFAKAVTQVLGDRRGAEEIGARGMSVAASVSRADVVAGQIKAFLDGMPGPDPARVPILAVARRPLWFLLSYTPHLKRFVVRVLRRLHLKRPAPEAERQVR